MRVSLLLLFVAGVARAAEGPKTPVEKAVAEARTAWDVPGMAVAVVRIGKPAELVALGTKQHGKDEPVSADTVFPLASCTKAFTAALVASLVDTGELSWADAPRKFLPDFALSDPHADALVTVRDLFQHRTGLAGHDLVWYRASWGPEEAVKRIAKLPLSGPFRGEFRYTSLPVTAAGLVAAKAGGGVWDVLIRKRLCDPLGMKAVAFTTAEYEKQPDRAAGHRIGAKGIEQVAGYPMPVPEPAGSMACSARDLVPWIELHLNNGKHGGKPLITAENLAETRHPATALRRTAAVRDTHPTATQVSHAMGWVVYDHRGKLVVAHGGNIDGFRALVMLAPDDGVGLAVLANLHDTRMNMALGHTLLDLLLDLPATDWHAHYKKVAKAEADAKAEARQAVDRGRDPAVRPSIPLADMAGTYDHPAYGEGKLTAAGGKLVWEWSSFKVELEPWRGDVFRAAGGYFDGELFGVRVVAGKATGFVQRDIEFVRK